MVTVGQELYLVDSGNRARYKVEHRPCVVTKVGRKYFDVVYGEFKDTVTFTLDEWKQKTEYSQDYWLFASKEEWEETLEANKWVSAFREAFNYGRPKATLEQYRQAAELLGIKLAKANGAKEGKQ